MTTSLDHPMVRDYLTRLEHATAGLPADERTEIREGITAHLAEELAGAASDADVRNALATLGDPFDIVGSPPAVQPPPRRGALEVVAVVLLLIGAFVVPVVGWFVGVVLLWTSRVWTTGQKLLGTLVFPGGLAAVVVAWLFPIGELTQSCSSESSLTAVGGATETVEMCAMTGPPLWLTVALAVILLLGPIFTAVYLLRAAGRPGPQRHGQGAPAS